METTLCGYCHNEINELFFFCPHCGVHLRTDHSEINAFGENDEYQKHAKKRQVKCKSCNLFFDNDFEHCPWCGINYQDQPNDYEKEGPVEPIGELLE